VHQACGHGWLCPQWLTKRCACTVSGLPSSRSSPPTSMPASLARWGAASAARLCPFSLAACPPPRHGSPGADRAARVTPSVACRRGSARSSQAGRPGRHVSRGHAHGLCRGVHGPASSPGRGAEAPTSSCAGVQPPASPHALVVLSAPARWAWWRRRAAPPQPAQWTTVTG